MFIKEWHNIRSRSTVPRTLMEGSLVPSECVKGIFSEIWGSGGVVLESLTWETPAELETWWGGGAVEIIIGWRKSVHRPFRSVSTVVLRNKGDSVTLEQRVEGPLMRTSTGELGGAFWVTATDLVLLPTFIRKPDCDSQSMTWVRCKSSNDCFRCSVMKGTGVRREGCMACFCGASWEMRVCNRMLVVERHSCLGTWLSLAVRKPDSKFFFTGWGSWKRGKKSHIWETSGVGAVEVSNRNSGCKLVEGKWGWSWDEEVMSKKPVKHGLHQRQTVLVEDLSLDSLYCKPCLMGIMITEHQCFLELKKRNMFLAYSKLPWGARNEILFKQRLYWGLCSAKKESN